MGFIVLQFLLLQQEAARREIIAEELSERKALYSGASECYGVHVPPVNGLVTSDSNAVNRRRVNAGIKGRPDDVKQTAQLVAAAVRLRVAMPPSVTKPPRKPLKDSQPTPYLSAPRSLTAEALDPNTLSLPEPPTVLSASSLLQRLPPAYYVAEANVHLHAAGLGHLVSSLLTTEPPDASQSTSFEPRLNDAVAHDIAYYASLFHELQSAVERRREAADSENEDGEDGAPVLPHPNPSTVAALEAMYRLQMRCHDTKVGRGLKPPPAAAASTRRRGANRGRQGSLVALPTIAVGSSESAEGDKEHAQALLDAAAALVDDERVFRQYMKKLEKRVQATSGTQPPASAEPSGLLQAASHHRRSQQHLAHVIQSPRLSGVAHHSPQSPRVLPPLSPRHSNTGSAFASSPNSLPLS